MSEANSSLSSSASRLASSLASDGGSVVAGAAAPVVAAAPKAVSVRVLDNGTVVVKGHSRPSWISGRNPRLLTISVKSTGGNREVPIFLRDHYTVSPDVQSQECQSFLKALEAKGGSGTFALVKEEDVAESFSSSFSDTTETEPLDF